MFLFRFILLKHDVAVDAPLDAYRSCSDKSGMFSLGFTFEMNVTCQLYGPLIQSRKHKNLFSSIKGICRVYRFMS